MLIVKNLEKDFKRFKIDKISFFAERGEITGIVGNNGAGKTTVLKCVLGVLGYDSGEIMIDGLTLARHEKAYKEKIGVVFDNGYFYENLTLEEMKKIISNAYKNWDEEVYQEYIKEYKLDAKQKIDTLSQGMKMKYALALALSHNAEILIFDEPTRGIDVAAKVEIYNLMNQLKQQGIAVMFVSSEMPEVMGIADRIVVMCDGRITGELVAEEATQNSILTLATRFEKKIDAKCL